MKRALTDQTDTSASTSFLRMLFWRLRRGHFASFYLPERHYMRGPGPKSRAKRDLPTGTL